MRLRSGGSETNMGPGRWAGTAVGVAILSVTVGLLQAQDAEDLRRGVARISLADGQVSIQRGDSGEWVAATVNAPVLTGDHLATAPNSRAEVEFDSGNVLRLGGNADLTLTQLESNRYQMTLGRGTATFRVSQPSGIDIEVDTPSVSVRPSNAGTYRISVTESGDSEITARAGNVEVFTPRGSQWVYAGQTMLARGSASDPEFQIVQAAPPDDWDRWSDSRDRAIATSPSYRYVPPGVYGAEDLDHYGNWVNDSQYGPVWQPVEPAGWAPYQAGRWAWLDWYGWTWVSYDPWGWAPYHYGRWFYAPARGWCWYPGAVGIRHYWSPALVAFFGFGGGGVGFGFGNIGWVPLAPYEVLHPWWGRAYGGYFNRSVNIVNVNVWNTYRNARIANGFSAVSGNDFRAGRFNNFLRPGQAELTHASFARGPIPVSPERANLQYAGRGASYVPRTAPAPRVFSYRQPTPVARTPFGGMQSATRGSTPAPGFARGSQNAPAPQSFARTPQSSPTAPYTGRQPSFQPTTPRAVDPPARSPYSGWQRFGEPRAVQPAPQPQAQTLGGAGRFGEPYAAPPAQRSPAQRNAGPQPQSRAFGGFQSNSRPEPLRLAPPVVRERPNSGGGFSAPRGFGAPRTPSAPQHGGGFSAPRQQSAPRGGGGGGSRGEGRRR